MTLEILTCPQNSPEWHAARCGLATASEFSSILAKGEGKTRRSYLLRLAGERITGVPTESFETADMVRGHTMEPEARAYYQLVNRQPVEEVGFMRTAIAGYSPDGLVGETGLLEIKTKKPPLLIELLLKGGMPAEHKAQCQGGLWVSGREWLDLVVYWPGMPVHIIREHRDETYIANLAKSVDAFNDELEAMTAWLRGLM